MMAGWEVETMSAALPGVLSLAAASGEELGTVSDIVTDAMTAFNIEIDESGASVDKFADLLASASSSSNTSVSLLGESFKYVAPLMGALGASTDDTALALGLMANAGIKGGQAGNMLKNSITRMIDPAKDAADTMSDLGITTKFNSDGSLDLAGTMGKLRETFKTLTPEQQAQAAASIFGKESMSGMLAIINASEEDYAALTEATTNYTGAAKEMADTMQGNLKGAITTLKSAMEELMLKVFDILGPVLEKIAGKVQDFVTWLNSLDEATQETIVKIGLLVAALGPILFIVGKVMSSFSKLTGALGAIASPIGAVIIILGLLVAGFVYLWKTNEQFRDKVIEVWNKVKKVIGESWEKFIKPVLEALYDKFKDIVKWFQENWVKIKEVFVMVGEVMMEIWETVIKPTLEFLWEIVKDIVAWVKDNWPLISKTFETVFNIIKSIWENILKPVLSILWDILKSILTWVNENWEGISNVFTTVFNIIKSVWDNVLKPVLDIFLSILGVIVDFVSGTFTIVGTIIEGVMKVIGWALEPVIKLFDTLADGVKKAWEWLTKWNRTPAKDKNIKVTRTTIDVGSKGGGTRGIDKNARGTNFFEGGLSWVGEQGPELLRLPKASQIYSNQKSEGMAGFNAKEIADAIIDGFKREGFSKPAVITLDGREVGRGIVNVIDNELGKSEARNLTGRGVLI